MENYAKRLALEHGIQGKTSKRFYPIIELKKDFEIIRKAYDVLTESISLDIPIPPSGEWLLDNFYIIEEQVSVISDEISLKQFLKLPAVKGKARIFLIADAMVEVNDGNITNDFIKRFIRAYSSKRKLSMEEIWMLPVALKVALIKYIRIVADRIIASQYQKFKVASLIERIIKNKSQREQSFYKYKNINLNGEITAYVEFLVYLLKKEGKNEKKYINILSEEVKKAGTTLDEVIKVEHYDMALRRVSMSNSITSIKNILRYNFVQIFEEINGIEEILNKDIWYEKSDFDTKNLYRSKIQKLAQKLKLSESYVAEKLIDFSNENNEHIGEYLVGEKENEFYEKISGRKKRVLSNKDKLFIYLLFIYVPAIIVSILTMNLNFWIALIPFSEVFVLLANKFVTKTQKPTILPRLEDIPEDANTFVIVPTLLNNSEKVKEIIQNLEVFYLGNKLPNLYFALLGDASEESTEHMDFDETVKNTGTLEVQKLNEKYGEERFFFLYRKRVFNKSQGKFLGYERKRGMITEFVQFLLTKAKGTFLVNTINEIPQIKYIITLDCDTILPMDTAKKLIGVMEHPINKPIISGKTVVKGHALIQPKVGISMESSVLSDFSKMFAGSGGIDPYSTAESNVYQDLFDEAIFTGKGIFNVEIFNKLLKDEIPENTVLSHDLLEGSYLRCGLASDIEVIDGFPSRVNSYMLRLSRWTRGDWQIISWLFKGPLNSLSKYKIFDNLRRSLLDIFLLALFFVNGYIPALFVIFFPFILDLLNVLFCHRSGKKSKNYLPIFDGASGSFIRCFFNLLFLPYKAVLMIKAIGITLYRLLISKTHMLDWVTAADGERILGKKLKDYIFSMSSCFVVGILLVLDSIFFKFSNTYVSLFLFVLWSFTPIVSFFISRPINYDKEKTTPKDEDYLKDIALKTWKYFDDYMNEKNNFLPPDNYQVGRKKDIVTTTSSTNIGLALLSIISASDLKFINNEECIFKLKKILDTIFKLEKWNGHLYNWYNIEKLEPLYPRFISTVDSGNFVGYLYVVMQFLANNNEEEYRQKVEELIKDTDFSKLYDFEKNLFSIGFDIRENRLVDSYYDLLASEARLASFVAIAKRDVPYKHWFSMSRSLTTVDRYKGLVSWSGTMFEYFMPLIVMKSYKYTILDETYDFCIYSQRRYAKKLGIPWGISESAFNLQDLNLNYQYKAFGIPWLGLKRGLKDEIVVAPYSSFLALSKSPKEVLKNAEELKKLGAFDKYGFYDSIDFTPSRMYENKGAIVKTYMAHHEALILLSINNYLNDEILQKRFGENTEIKCADLLLQERVPANIIFTKKKKEKVKIMKYKSYEEHVESIINNPAGNVNIQSNGKYTLVINDFGEGYSNFDNILVTRYKDSIKQSMCMYIKNLETQEMITNTPYPMYNESDEYEIKFSPSDSSFYRKSGDIDVTTKIAVSSEENIEVRVITIKNNFSKSLNLDLITYVEPVLTYKNNDIVHPAYNNLFFRASKYKTGVLLNKRSHNESLYYINFLTFDKLDNLEIELDKSKVIGRLRDMKNPIISKQDVAFSNETNMTTNTIISFRGNLKLEPNESQIISCFYGVSKKYDNIINMYEKYNAVDSYKRIFELAYSKSLVENRFLGYKGKDIIVYNKLFSMIDNNKTREKYKDKINQNILKQNSLWRFGISGDLPIILVRINRVNDVYVINDLILAVEYFYKKGLKVDLVIFNEEDSKYEQYVQDRLYEIISAKNLNYLLHQNGGIFIVKKNDVSVDEENLIFSHSDIILNARDGFLKEQLYDE